VIGSRSGLTEAGLIKRGPASTAWREKACLHRNLKGTFSLSEESEGKDPRANAGKKSFCVLPFGGRGSPVGKKEDTSR